MNKQQDTETNDTSDTIARRQERDDLIDQSLQRAMHCYAARWLPIFGQQEGVSTSQYEHVSRECWRAMRRDILKVVNRISYRSVLTLYLFGLTPVPRGISEEEEEDGISGLICIQTALLQIQQLRQQLRSCQADVSEEIVWPDPGLGFGLRVNLSETYLKLESRAHWAAVMWDTSSAMTLNIRSSLTSGLKGACMEPSWRVTRAFLVGSIPPQTEEWRKESFEFTDEIACEIISAAAICRIYTWRTITSLKEALRECVEDEAVDFAWDALLDALEIFKTTIYPLLNHCERQLHFLGQAARLYWYETMLHYYLGILILVEALETARRPDFLSQITNTRLEAEHECFNVLKFGLESIYTVDEPSAGLNKASGSLLATGRRSTQSISISFVAIDPYLHHLIAAVRLMNKAIIRKYRRDDIKDETYTYLTSTLLRALQHLPQCCKTVGVAKDSLQASLDKAEADFVADMSLSD
ncbi:hypothetical protein A1O1_07525 [Capronia coronata CBS 617.96]|uniref:Transcription factor domain-containing protein n=1 Tax=Capronia coronata CBS 617.96 TaxID=1182541 RepID=W9Y3X5_9EURO|nr:uncharacterized protein A1O1_07525 [Capronia coronata CBS 617.96]EXJ83896.1 hypothetical protein A1O1_07525 [Capronia coronata CBS 617.96]